MTQLFHCLCPVGPLTLAADQTGLVGLWLDGQKYFAATLPPDAQPCETTLPIFDQAISWLRGYFDGAKQPPAFPLAPKGSPFRQLVWKKLSVIPYGQLVTYGELAKQISAETRRPVSAQAVGGAVGHNPISLIIPCHRVVGSDGSLTGYAGGISVKQQLLALEGHRFDDKGRVRLG
ncbi:MAG: methylated-DNA--[protein]-cysteine S-methyltransferase [Pygmaiobacter massiliensis]|nr:methylated-DNA--[protein]-cysteine S-methyltransferase [Pygmaiobacter massiliensis]